MSGREGALKWAFVSVVYTALVAAISAKWNVPSFVPGLSSIAAWLSFVPLAVVAGWAQLRFRTALVAYVCLVAEALIVNTLALGEPLTGSSVAPAWYTPILFVAMYTALIGLLAIAPTGLAFLFARAIRLRVSRG